MAFAFDNDQRDFSGTVTEYLRDRARKSHGNDPEARGELWAELLALDLTALLIPEELDGLGLTPVDMVAVLEAAGRFALPVPLATTVGPFTAAVVAAGTDDPAARQIISKLLAGASGTLAPTHGSPDPLEPPSATLDGDRLSVPHVLVPDADADLVAVPTRSAGTNELVLIVASPAEFGMSAVDGMDATNPVGVLELTDCQVPDAVVLTYNAHAVLPTAWIAAAAELVGLAAELLDRSVAHARDRVQFGRPIGAFQGVKHRLVDVHVGIERARSLTLYGALAIVEQRPDLVRAAHRAKAAASEAASASARAAVQVHGGSGITAEEAVSGLYLRARQKSMLLGGHDQHYEAARTA